MKHAYTISMQPVRRSRLTVTKLTIAADGRIIGARNTRFRRLFVSVCSKNQAYAVANLHEEIDQMKKRTNLFDRAQQGDWAAFATLELRMRSGQPITARQDLIAQRNLDIAAGKYAERAESTRLDIAKQQAELARLRSGPDPAYEQPYVKCMCQWLKNALYDVAPYEKLVDILVIRVP